MKQIVYILAIVSCIIIASISCKTSRIDAFPEDSIRMHAHNDYLHSRPLLDALDLGYTSIEIDIIKYDSRLIVSHDGHGLDHKPHIVDLYITPLKEYIEKNDLNIWLLIDLKKYDKETLALLHDIAVANKDIFSTRSEEIQKKALKIILSGDMPRREIADNPEYKYFFIDGRPENLNEEYDSHIMPLISTNLATYAVVSSEGGISALEKNKIAALVNDTHDQGKKFRFWNTKDHERSWSLLREIGVDLIGSDDLKRLSDFMSNTVD